MDLDTPLSFLTTFGIPPRRPSAFVPQASGGEPTEQRAGRKKIRLSEPSELPDFPTCERREGVRSARSLDFWLLLGQAKSDEKRFFASL
ncbi:hypothetical protein [Tannerella forsythia]|uniref:hypothetical protein n=1 Tax=Tannerella forsythia TaxID=28112 RepID=UPI0012D8C981|nr:hypothetical protein [Tannerella forsythia]